MSNKHEDPEIELELVIHPEGQGTLNTVAVGLGDMPTILIISEETEDGVKFTLKTGYPFEQSEEGIDEISTFLGMFVDSFKSEQFKTAWAEQTAKLEAGRTEEEEL